jgi:outer membrane protein TolC
MCKRNRFNGQAKLLLVTSMMLVSQVFYGQDSAVKITLEEAVQATLQQNMQLTLAKKDELIAQSKYKETEAIWLPQINFSYTGVVSNQPLAVFGFKLQQALVRQSDFDPALLNHPGSNTNVTTQVNLLQPMYNPDLIYMRRAAAANVSAYTFQTQRTRQSVVLEVSKSFLQLEYAYEVVKVLADALKTVQEIYRFTDNRYAQGLLQKSDVLNVEVQVKEAEVSLTEAKSQIITFSDQLGLIMNASRRIVYIPASDMMQLTDTISDNFPLERADIKAMKTALAAYDLSIKSTRLSRMPKLNGFANYQLNDKNLFGFGAHAYMAGIQLSWNIFNGNQSKNKMATQQLEKKKLAGQMQNNIVQDIIEIRKIKRQLTDLEFRLSQKLLSVEAAAEALRIVQNRYSQGLVPTTDVLMAQTQVAQQKMLFAQAVFMKKSAMAYLQFLTETK